MIIFPTTAEIKRGPGSNPRPFFVQFCLQELFQRFPVFLPEPVQSQMSERSFCFFSEYVILYHRPPLPF